MKKLSGTLDAWNTSRFEETLKHELESMGIDGLPLQRGMLQGSMPAEGGLGVMLLRARETD